MKNSGRLLAAIRLDGIQRVWRYFATESAKTMFLRQFVILFLICLHCGCGLLAQERYAIAIGVEKYGEDFNNLEFSEEDALSIGQSFDRLGYNTIVMTAGAEKSSRIPSSAAKIRNVIATRARSCQPGDTLVIFLSGHGLQFEGDEKLASGDRELYFCPQDAKVTDKSTLLSINSQVLPLLKECKATRQLLIVDACRNDRLSQSARRKGNFEKIVLGSIHETRMTVPEGTVVMFSCSPGQFSWEHEGHGVFTRYLANYLSGKAESAYYDGENADINGLVSYVSRHTNDHVVDNGISSDGQYPVCSGTASNWKLGIVEKDNQRDGMPSGQGVRAGVAPSTFTAFRDRLKPWGEIPPGWQEVVFDDSEFTIAKNGLCLEGDFVLEFRIQDEMQGARFGLRLTGSNDNDVAIGGYNWSPFSDGTTWVYSTPEGNALKKSVVHGDNQYRLTKTAQKIVFEAVNSVRSEDDVVSEFKVNEACRFDAIEVTTNSRHIQFVSLAAKPAKQ